MKSNLQQYLFSKRKKYKFISMLRCLFNKLLCIKPHKHKMPYKNIYCSWWSTGTCKYQDKHQSNMTAWAWKNKNNNKKCDQERHINMRYALYHQSNMRYVSGSCPLFSRTTRHAHLTLHTPWQPRERFTNRNAHWHTAITIRYRRHGHFTSTELLYPWSFA